MAKHQTVVVEHNTEAAQVKFIEEWLDAGGSLEEIACAPWPDTVRTVPVMRPISKEN